MPTAMHGNSFFFLRWEILSNFQIHGTAFNCSLGAVCYVPVTNLFVTGILYLFTFLKYNFLLIEYVSFWTLYMLLNLELRLDTATPTAACHSTLTFKVLFVIATAKYPALQR